MTAPREKPAPLVWKETRAHWDESARVQIAAVDRLCVVIWHVGGHYAWRSKLRRDGSDVGRIVSHFGESGAKTSAERRLRKAGE